jgi:hypothetical protein
MAQSVVRFAKELSGIQQVAEVNSAMKVLFWAGVVILVFGVVTLFAPIPQTHTRTLGNNDFKLSVQTREEEKLPPIASAALILGGAGMMITGAGSFRRN